MGAKIHDRRVESRKRTSNLLSSSCTVSRPDQDFAVHAVFGEEHIVFDGTVLHDDTSLPQNHSCNPNCIFTPIYINQGDIQQPYLALFARRDVARGEELTISYHSSSEGTTNVSVAASIKVFMAANTLIGL